MKKIVWLFLFLLLIGCAGTPVKQSEDYSPTASYQMSPEAIEKMIDLLSETEANKIRAFTGRTGGTSGKLDSISVSTLSNNDVGIVFDVSDSSIYFYIFNSTATDEEVDPFFIRPDDYSSAGVWYWLSTFGGTLSLTPITDAATDFASVFTGVNLYGGTFLCDTAGTIQLPAVGVGMNFSIITVTAIAVVVEPNSNDKILLDGTLLHDADSATNLSTAGDIIVFQYMSADGWVATSNGWTDED